MSPVRHLRGVQLDAGGSRPSKVVALAITASVAVVAVILGVMPAFAAPAALRVHDAQATLPNRLLITVRARIKAFASPTYTRNSVMAPREVIFTPAVVNVGTVIVLVINSDDMYHYFQIAGVSSRRLGPGGRAKLHVTFKRPGIYDVGVTGPDPINVDGFLKVIK